MSELSPTAFLDRIGPIEPGSTVDVRWPGRAIYLQLAEAIGVAIDGGRLAAGDRLPAERELAHTLGVSRDTVRQALAELQRHGRLIRTVGRAGGTFVAAPKVQRDLSRFTGLADQLKEQRSEGGARVLSARERSAGPAIAAALELAPGTRIHEIVRVRMVAGSPVALEHTYYPADRLPGLLDQRLDGPTHEILRDVYGDVPVRAIEYLEPILAGPEEARTLEIEEGAPLMYVERVAFDKAGVPLEFSKDIYRGDRTRMVVWGDDELLKR